MKSEELVYSLGRDVGEIRELRSGVGSPASLLPEASRATPTLIISTRLLPSPTTIIAHVAAADFPRQGRHPTLPDHIFGLLPVRRAVCAHPTAAVLAFPPG